jgi:hypothetical protein
MTHSPRLLLTAALGLAALPLLTAAAPATVSSIDPACSDPVARTIHQAEETTGLRALHTVEEAYCAARP